VNTDDSLGKVPDEIPDHNRDELDVAFAEFRRITVPAPPPDEEMLARLGSLAAVSLPAPSSAVRRSRLRWTAYAAAGLAASVLVSWVLLTGGSPSAFAGVVQAVGKHKLVRHTQTQTTDFIPAPEGGKVPVLAPGPDGNTQAVGVRTAYQDLRARRFRTEYRSPRSGLVFLEVQDYTKGRWLTTQPERKEAIVFAVEGRDVKLLIDFVREFGLQPRVTAEKTTLDGGRVVKYQLAEGQRETIIWVNPESRLPIRVEFTDRNPHPTIIRNTFVWSDFEWDPDVKDIDQLFSTDPPKGYAVSHRLQLDAQK
jgi:hypothetical protein